MTSLLKAESVLASLQEEIEYLHEDEVDLEDSAGEEDMEDMDGASSSGDEGDDQDLPSGQARPILPARSMQPTSKRKAGRWKKMLVAQPTRFLFSELQK